ncbi:MAG TPA: hypothetical protein VF812_17890 [Ktedonobacterales bacterium]
MADGVFRPQSDDEFQEWQQGHPHGYIINAPKSGDGEMMWHQSQCMHIYGDYEDFGSYLHRDKLCADNPAALAVWAKQRSNPLTYCQTCQAEWAKRAQ